MADRKARTPKDGYKIRKKKYTVRDVKYTAYEISVPPIIAEQIPDGTTFTVELTEDGLLYRRIKTERPSWLRDTK